MKRHIDLNEIDSFGKKDLKHFKKTINSFNIPLREKLDLDKDVTFGLEFEFLSKNKYKLLKTKLSNDYNIKIWKIKPEPSFTQGFEIVTPVLKDETRTWIDVKNICSFISENGKITEDCASHIHVGVQTLGNKKESWLNFIKLWGVYENIIYRFSYGEYLSSRPKINKYAIPLSRALLHDYDEIKDKNLEELITSISYIREQAVNFNNIYKDECDNFFIDNTIEFRCPNGTLNPVIWQNNINFFVNLLKYSKSTSFNMDIVDKRYSLNKEFEDIKMYNEIYLDQALELCNMIFNNNIDKLYFLKQYLKSFEISDKFKKAKRITK